MSGELWAAWVSAGGGLLAVGVSVYLHNASLDDRKAAEATAARSAALAVLPYFREAEKSLTWSLSQLKAGRDPSDIGTDESGQDFGIGCLRVRFDRFAPTLDRLGQLGAAAGAAQRAYHHFRELSTDLDGYSAQDLWPGDKATYKGTAWVATHALLEKTESEMRTAVAQMASLLQ